MEKFEVRTGSAILDKQRNDMGWREDHPPPNFSQISIKKEHVSKIVGKENGYQVPCTTTYLAFDKKWFSFFIK